MKVRILIQRPWAMWGLGLRSDTLLGEVAAADPRTAAWPAKTLICHAGGSALDSGWEQQRISH